MGSEPSIQDWELIVARDLAANLIPRGQLRRLGRPDDLSMLPDGAYAALAGGVGTGELDDMLLVPAVVRPIGGLPWHRRCRYAPLCVLGIGERGVGLWTEGPPAPGIRLMLAVDAIAVIEHEADGPWRRLTVAGASTSLSVRYDSDGDASADIWTRRLRQRCAGRPQPLPGSPVPRPAVPPEAAAPSDAVPRQAVPPDTLPPDTAYPDTVPAAAVRPDALPSSAAPANAVPTNAAPPSAVPSSAVPSNVVPSNVVPSNVVRPFLLGEADAAAAVGAADAADAPLAVAERWHSRVGPRSCLLAVTGQEIIAVSSSRAPAWPWRAHTRVLYVPRAAVTAAIVTDTALADVALADGASADMAPADGATEKAAVDDAVVDDAATSGMTLRLRSAGADVRIPLPSRKLAVAASRWLVRPLTPPCPDRHPRPDRHP